VNIIVKDKTINDGCYCERCEAEISSHYDNSTNENPAKKRICDSCEIKIRYGIGKKRFFRHKK
jgi:hypothetical protein